MNPEFNLLDEPWIPVQMMDGRVKEMGLLALFDQLAHVKSLAETSPTSLVAQYRLLLAVTHRALTMDRGTWKEQDRITWFSEGIPKGVVEAYLNHWRERFWLFHPEYPFMQVAELATLPETADKTKPWTQISLASASGNTAVMFDHSNDVAPIAVCPGTALRELLGFLQFTPGGLVKVLSTSDKAGPLSNTAAVVPIGKNLNQTLLLSLHPSQNPNDLPAWERPAPQRLDIAAEPALATGANDRYTRLSRSVLFRRTETGHVQNLHFAEGMAMLDDPNAPDPMASFRAGKEKMVRVTFSDGKAFWRDMPALLPDAEGKQSKPATVLGLAVSLQMAIGDRGDQAYLVAGLASDQAKLLRWRCEQLVLPPAVLCEAGLAEFLREKVRQAEALHKRIRTLGTHMLAATMPDSTKDDTLSRARSLFDGGATTPLFFSIAERALPELLSHIAKRDAEAAENGWSNNLLVAAQASWTAMVHQLGHTPKAVRAEALEWLKFQGLLHEFNLVRPTTQSTKEAQA